MVWITSGMSTMWGGNHNTIMDIIQNWRNKNKTENFYNDDDSNDEDTDYKMTSTQITIFVIALIIDILIAFISLYFLLKCTCNRKEGYFVHYLASCCCGPCYVIWAMFFASPRMCNKV
jgi:hypothetical protein